MGNSSQVVMVFSGNDPTGGAGLLADSEALISMGCHPAPVPTSLTVQNTQGMSDIYVSDVTGFIAQCRAVLEDISVAAIKIGLVPDVGTVNAIHTLIQDLDVPIVLDPVLAPSQGTYSLHDDVVEAIKTLLFPWVTVVTPNGQEARRFAPAADNLNACAQAILEMGCEYVLITGTDEKTEDVQNLLYSNHRDLDVFKWPRIPGQYHGTGCTLASAIAGLLAKGRSPHTAIIEAQKYTLETIKNAIEIGKGQLIPNRFYWTNTKRYLYE